MPIILLYIFVASDMPIRYVKQNISLLLTIRHQRKLHLDLIQAPPDHQAPLLNHQTTLLFPF